MTAKYAVVKNGSNLQEIQAGDRLNGESTGVYFDTIALSSADISALGGGLNVVPAQGAGTIAIPTFAFLQFNAGSEVFANNSMPLYLYLDDGDFFPVLSVDQASFSELGDSYGVFFASGSLGVTANIVNKPIVLKSENAIGYTGSILTSSINSGGTGHTVSDTITIGDALITVNTVDGGGAVLTYTVTGAGSGFVVDVYNQDSTSGSGIDFSISVDSITPLSNGTASLYIEYKVIPVV